MVLGRTVEIGFKGLVKRVIVTAGTMTFRRKMTRLGGPGFSRQIQTRPCAPSRHSASQSWPTVTLEHLLSSSLRHSPPSSDSDFCPRETRKGGYEGKPEIQPQTPWLGANSSDSTVRFLPPLSVLVPWFPNICKLRIPFSLNLRLWKDFQVLRKPPYLNKQPFIGL